MDEVKSIFLTVCSLICISRYFLAKGYAVIFLHRESSLKPFQRHFSQENFLDWLKLEGSNNFTGTSLPHWVLHFSMGMGHDVYAVISSSVSIPEEVQSKLSNVLSAYNKVYITPTRRSAALHDLYLLCYRPTKRGCCSWLLTLQCSSIFSFWGRSPVYCLPWAHRLLCTLQLLYQISTSIQLTWWVSLKLVQGGMNIDHCWAVTDWVSVAAD